MKNPSQKSPLLLALIIINLALLVLVLVLIRSQKLAAPQPIVGEGVIQETPESMPGQLSSACQVKLSKIKRSDPAELVTLYEELVEQQLVPEIMSNGCDFGPESVYQECLKREEIHRQKLVCMQELVEKLGITKQDLLTTQVF